MSTPREKRYIERNNRENNLLPEVNENLNLNTETTDTDTDDSFISVLNSTIENFSNLTLIDTKSELIKIKMAALDKNLALKMLPEFDGNHEHLTKFLDHCNFFYKPLVEADEKAIFLQIVKLKLVGQAGKIFKYKTLNDWESFATELELQFLKKESYISLHKKLLNIKQYSNEDIRSYANRIQQLVSELNSTCVTMDKDCKVESINADYALNTFINGLSNHDIKIILKCRDKLDLKTAVELAAREELSFNKPFIPFNFHNNNQTQQNYNSGAIKKEPGTFIRKFCTNCKISNHDISECRRLAQSQSSYSRNPVCSFCGKSGHLSNRCYTKYFNNSKNSNGSDQYQGQINRATRTYAQQLPVQFTNNNNSSNPEQFQQIQTIQTDQQMQYFPQGSNQHRIDSFPK